MLKQAELRGQGRKFQPPGENMTPQVLWVKLPEAEDAKVQIGEGLIIAVTEVVEDVSKVALDQPVKKADLIEHGKWKVTTVDGSRYFVDLLNGKVKKLAN